MRKYLGSPLLLIAILALAPRVFGQLDAPPLVIRNATLIDGTGKPPQPNQQILIVHGAIQEIGPKVNPPDKAQEIDAAGKFVIPGLIDARVQLNASPANRVYRAEAGAEQRLAWMHAMLADGVTTVRLTQGDLPELLAYKRLRQGNYLNGPELIVAGPAFTAFGGNPANQYSILAINQRHYEVKEVDTHEQARDESRNVAHGGAESFEVVYDQGSDLNPLPHLSDDALQTIIKEAHDHDLKVYCLVGRDAEARQAVAAGADVLEGVTEDLLSDATLAEMKKKEVSFLPMLVNQGDFVHQLAPEALQAYLARAIVQQSLSPVMRKSLESAKGTLAQLRQALDQKVLLKPAAEPGKQEPSGAAGKPETITVGALLEAQARRAVENVRRAHAAGLRVIVGSGSPSPLNFPGAAVHRELELLVQAGLTPLEALQAATRDNAVAAGREKELGTVEVGRKADLVILDANPLADITNTQKIDTVVRGGRIVKPKDVDYY